MYIKYFQKILSFNLTTHSCKVGIIFVLRSEVKKQKLTEIK